MQKCHLAVDIGASSGRVIAGFMEDEKLQLDVIHRFPNEMKKKNGHLIWDIDFLFNEIKKGIQLSTKKYKPITIGIDTWAVDFVLLDKDYHRLTDAIAYRDHRTDGMMEKVFERIPKETIYAETGIQFQPFNTLYQLAALKEETPEVFEQANYFLMIPDYLNFLLTGKISNEYTNATTTQLLGASSKDWLNEVLQSLDVPKHLFSTPTEPLSSLGEITAELKEEFGTSIEVILPGTHDTASAVAAVPSLDTIYISSGTWSLMGVELDKPITSHKAFSYNFTNEGGINHSIRFLKNIMGLWMIQQVRKEWDNKYSFAEFVDLAYEKEDFPSIVDVNSEQFLSPSNMIEEIQAYCKNSNQPIPVEPGEVAACIFNSLVEDYCNTAKQIEELTNREYSTIHVIGGGSQNNYLNEKLAEKSGKTIYTGPTEATAIGNIIAQMVATGEISSFEESKSVIQRSFEIHKFK
ncbi:rhamnulokinase [Gracilibacillus halotolerans]|uniref:Rhamnulokinase n=1 Tax=Gracilibacillus halotolerans TaxID=74386 RepID=A0A841RCB3_9BACI|nr:rhamnulokinase [Gracilibacillus halotolerans]MBB6511570.1 rhamnulokinase [Gracilibacillus halotolerans]